MKPIGERLFNTATLTLAVSAIAGWHPGVYVGYIAMLLVLVWAPRQ